MRSRKYVCSTMRGSRNSYCVRATPLLPGSVDSATICSCAVNAPAASSEVFKNARRSIPPGIANAPPPKANEFRPPKNTIRYDFLRYFSFELRSDVRRAATSPHVIRPHIGSARIRSERQQPHHIDKAPRDLPVGTPQPLPLAAYGRQKYKACSGLELAEVALLKEWPAAP